jgi:N-acyl amino acid synthase of PEP-CTERM/exosortase system
MKSNLNLCDDFNQAFKIVVADTPALREEVYKIRFNVYCEELEYESAEKFPDKMERDGYDSRSIHCLVQYRQTGEYAGCIRLVTYDAQSPFAMFPGEKLIQESGALHPPKLERSQFAEISRIAVKAKFRKRLLPSSDGTDSSLSQESQGQNPSEQPAQMPIISLGLYMIFTSIGKMLDLKLLCMMEARLARHCKLCGIPSEQIGEFVEYNGKRALYRMDPEEIVPNLPTETYELFKSIQHNLSQSAYLLGYKQKLSPVKEVYSRISA